MDFISVLGRKDIKWEWGKALRPTPGRGLRFFKERNLDCWALADNSGSRPDTTDDGVVWFDPGGTIILDKNKHGVFGSMKVWVHRTGERSEVTFGAETARWLFDTFLNMQLVVGGELHPICQLVRDGDARGAAQRNQQGEKDAEADDEGDVRALRADHVPVVGAVDDPRSDPRSLSELTNELRLATQYVLRDTL
jgi:hypothetical protein